MTRTVRAATLVLALVLVASGCHKPGHDRYRGSNPKRIAHAMLARSSMAGPGEWPCLRRLWQLESGWNPRADNPTSSAYGIPQAIDDHFHGRPRAERIYRASPRAQIRWGIRYVHRRYGSPCDALAFWRNPTTGPKRWGNWY